MVSINNQVALYNIRLAVAALAQGRFILAGKLLSRGVGRLTSSFKLFNLSLNATTTASLIARVAIGTLSVAVIGLGTALLVAVPYLAAFAAAAALLYEGFKAVRDSLRTEEEKAYAEQVETTTNTLQELSSSLVEN
jgi:hypothetical protein